MKIMYPGAIVIGSSNVAESTNPTYNPATAYAAGAFVYLPSNYGEYQALTANTGKNPAISPSDWKFLGTANKYRMFDQFLNTQTANDQTIEVTIVSYGAEAIYIGNIDATSVTVEVIDNTTLQVIESKTFTTYRDIMDWQDYYYGDWLSDKIESLTYERLTLTQDISFHVVIENGTNTARCGIFCCGKVKRIGHTKWNVSVGAIDYSTVSTDSQSGATYLLRSNYAKKLSIDVFVRTDTANAVYKALVNARGMPVVFLPGDYELLKLYGYIQKFEELVKGPTETAITVEVIGLV